MADKDSTYRFLSLLSLVEKIVTEKDLLALWELHSNRKICRYRNDDYLMIMEYIDKLRKNFPDKRWSGLNTLDIADCAYDLTLDKFINLPNTQSSSDIAVTKTYDYLKRIGPDCRFYYKAFLKRVRASFEENPAISEFEQESRAAEIFTGFIRRHFYFSTLEAVRESNKFWSRYNWEKQGSKITVRLPVKLKSSERKAWLEENIHDVNFTRAGERKRIQLEIYKILENEIIIPFNEDVFLPDVHQIDIPDTDKDFDISLAEQVANQKVKNINHQRESIRALGTEKLKLLILRIFDEISCGEYKDTEIAKAYGISKSTLSRFAGSKWSKKIKDSKELKIPDLWRNTAKVMAKNPVFMETVISSGFALELEEVLKFIESTATRMDKNGR